MATYLVIRDDQIGLRLMGASVEADGIVTAPTNKGAGYILDRASLDAAGLDISAVTAEIRGGWTPALRAKYVDHLARLGTNSSGMRVIEMGDWQREQDEAREAGMTDADRAYRAVSDLRRKAEALEHADYYDPAAIIQAQMAVDKAEAEWSERYPADAARRRAQALRDRAADRDRLASGALHYDADGWLDADARQQRHDEINAEAATLRAQAEKIEETL